MHNLWQTTDEVQREITLLRLLTGWSDAHAQAMVVRAAREYEVTLFAAARVLQALAADTRLPDWTAEPSA